MARVSPLQRTKKSGERRELPQRGAPAENGFWRILKATERSFLYLYDKICGRGQFSLASPRSKFWGDLEEMSAVSPLTFSRGSQCKQAGSYWKSATSRLMS